jgi:hypothetical protein
MHVVRAEIQTKTEQEQNQLPNEPAAATMLTLVEAEEGAAHSVDETRVRGEQQQARSATFLLTGSHVPR